MQLLHRPFSWLIKQRLNSLARSVQRPLETQALLLQQLIQKGRYTSYGQEFNFHIIKSMEDFQHQVPVRTYEQLYPYIEQTLKGKQRILWPTPIKWFAKSSGTTNDRSKFIPVSSESLQEGHYKAGKDMLALYLANYPDSQLTKGKSIGIGGSLCDNRFCPGSGTKYGDVSAVIMQNLPFWARWISTPSLSVSLMDQWEKKLEKLVSITVQENVTAIAGIPTWVLLLLQKVLEAKNKTCIHEVWPMLELFIHGGISFEPYRALFQRICSPAMHYVEVYNASEGFFAVQDQVQATDMLLLLDHGIFYEFIPTAGLGQVVPQPIGLEAVELGKVYALVISTNAGLWRYQLGDTIKFTSLSPYRIKIAGRTKHFINAFGEELMIENAEAAIRQACQLTGATIRDYTAGPCYIGLGKQGKHEWIVEFITSPNDLEQFVAMLDMALKKLNADYEAKRHQDLILARPLVRSAPQGLFYDWMKKRGKLGEQHKVPRLFNDRRYLDSLLGLLQEKSSLER